MKYSKENNPIICSCQFGPLGVGFYSVRSEIKGLSMSHYLNTLGIMSCLPGNISLIREAMMSREYMYKLVSEPHFFLGQIHLPLTNF